MCNQCLSPLILCVRFPLRLGVLDTTLCDKVCQRLATGLLMQFRIMSRGLGLGLWCLTPLSTIFQLCRGGQTGENYRPVASL
jgi:hypothetical protein